MLSLTIAHAHTFNNNMHESASKQHRCQILKKAVTFLHTDVAFSHSNIDIPHYCNAIIHSCIQIL